MLLVFRSSQCGMMASVRVAVGKQAFVNAVLLELNCKLPFEIRLAVVNGVP